MPEYVNKALKKLKHLPPSLPQNAPHRWVPITYGKKIQNVPVLESSPVLSELETRHIQKKLGHFYIMRGLLTTLFFLH